MAPTKLNSMRLLDSHKVPYEVHTYPYDPDDPPDAAKVAASIGLPPDRVFKTLVVGPGAGARPLLVMLPADRQLDLKRLAAAVGQKRLELLPRAETERLSGLKVGGIGALALASKRWVSCLDRSAEPFDIIYVNGGQRGTMLGLATADLVRVLDARWVEASIAGG